MTVSNNYAPVITAANGVTTVFTGSWNALSAANLFVQLLNTITGVYTTVTQGTGSSQYQVTSLTNTGWVITFNTAPASGNNVVVSRSTPQTQTIPYTTSRGFQGSVEEGSFDALTNMVQELTDEVENSIQVSVGDTTANLVLPIVSARANSYLGFDSNGNVIAIAGTSGSVNISTAMVPVVQSSTVAGALSLLGGVPSTSPLLYPQGGFKNKLHNGLMNVWQLGTASIAVSTSGAYTADRWIVTPTGAACTAQQTASNPRTGRQSAYSLLLTGATGVTDISLTQRIESIDSVALEGQQVTIQAQIYNNTGASITPTIATKIAGSTDNWTSPTSDLAAVNLQPCANGAWTEVAYSYQVGATAGNGLEVIFDFGNNFSTTGKSVQVTEVQLSITPGASSGTISSPPSIETRSISQEIALCSRYFTSTFGNGVTPAQNYGLAGALASIAAFTGAASIGANWTFPVPMRTVPTVTTYSTSAANANWWDINGSISPVASAGFDLIISTTGVFIGSTTTSITQGHLCVIQATASANL